MTTAAARSISADDPLDGTAYRTIALLGKGGMGEVFEAEHVGLGVRVVVKLLFRTNWARRDLKERMRVEAQTGARIRHENLVQVTDVGETVDGRTFLVMERLYGRSLADEIKARGHLPVPEAIEIARQILAGLSKAHEAGIVHRDIKPDNVFLCDERDGVRPVKVLDFGIAKIVDAAADPRTPSPLAVPTAEGIVVGTPRWASPEQANGEKDIDARSDVYSTALVLWSMVTGQEPFRGRKGLLELTKAHSTESLPSPSSIASQAVPAAAERVIMKALSKKREERFPSAAAFREELGRVEKLTAPEATIAVGARAGRVWASTEEIDPETAAELRRAAVPSRRPTGTVEMEPAASSQGVASRTGASRFASSAAASPLMVRTVELPDVVTTLASAGAPSAETREGDGAVRIGEAAGGRTAPAADGKGGTAGLIDAPPPRPVLPWERVTRRGRRHGWRIAVLCVVLVGILAVVLIGVLRGA